MIQRREVLGRNRMTEPFVSLRIYIELCTKRHRVIVLFCSLIYRIAVDPINRASIDVTFDEILVYLRS